MVQVGVVDPEVVPDEVLSVVEVVVESDPVEEVESVDPDVVPDVVSVDDVLSVEVVVVEAAVQSIFGHGWCCPLDVNPPA